MNGDHCKHRDANPDVGRRGRRRIDECPYSYEDNYEEIADHQCYLTQHHDSIMKGVVSGRRLPQCTVNTVTQFECCRKTFLSKLALETHKRRSQCHKRDGRGGGGGDKKVLGQ